ncbi:MAG: ABC transporter permease [Pseudomonadota bacterium]
MTRKNEQVAGITAVGGRTEPELTSVPRAMAPALRSRILRRSNWRGTISVVVFIVLWDLLVRLEVPGFKGIPTLVEVIRAFWSDYLWSSAYWESWLVSFQRVGYGFIVAQILGIPLGILLGTQRLFHELVYPVVELLRPIPPLAWVPLSILFWPTAELSIIFITFIGPFFIIVINVHDGVRSIKKEHMWLALSLGAKPRHIFRRIVLPSVIPCIAVGMTLGIAVSWNVVIAAEMIASDSGLGRLTWEGYVSHTATTVIIGMISIGVAGYLSTLLVNHAERKMMPWQT